MTKINPQRIYGSFVSGVALDVHTLSSTYVGVNEYGHEVYDTTRSEVGDLLYRLKYRSDRDAGNEIARVAAAFIGGSKTKFDVLVPVPPSGVRALQPVIFLANAIGGAVPLPVADCVTTTRPTEQLKGVTDRERRKELLAGLHAIDASKTEGRHILLFDDLFRSGSTLNAITDLMMGEGRALSVRSPDDYQDAEQRMNTVFIGGSRHVSRLPTPAKERLDNIVKSGFHIVVGDANGADKAVQKHLSGVAYADVEVFCSGDVCRNNLGDWPTRKIQPAKSVKGFQFYAAKDREMAQAADFGLMIWDGKSPGTVLNVLRLIKAGKKAVLVNSPEAKTTTFKAVSDWETFLTHCEAGLKSDLRDRATPDEWSLHDTPQPDLLDLGDLSTTSPEPADPDPAVEINQALRAGDSRRVVELLGTIAREYGMSQVAKDSGLARESLYRSLGADGNPEFATVLKVLASLGLTLTATRAA